MYEELVKRLRDDANRRSPCSAVGLMCSEAADAIEDLQKLTDAQLDIIKQYQVYLTKQHWISVTERLPRNKTEVLAYYGFVHDGEMSECRFIGVLQYFTIDANPHWQHESIGLTVTHWMPLPQPPIVTDSNQVKEE